MNIFIHELKSMISSSLWWILGLCALVLMFLTIYPAFLNDVEASKAIFANFPPAIRDAFGLSLDTLFTFSGFYSFTLTYTTLAAAVQGMNIGLSLLSKENRMKTMDFLLTKPVTRGSVFIGKLAAALVILSMTTIVLVAFSISVAKVIEPELLDISLFVLLSCSIYFIQLWFLAIGMLASVVFRRLKSVLSTSLGIVFAFFIIGTLGEVIGDDKVRYITPFKYFDYIHAIDQGAYEIQYMILWGCVVILAICAAFAIYRRRDVHSVS
ncbi:MAG: ABC transporter permease subunit [Actinobacteria bacterium]|nr:ABC transporter permease subunit [Actinomycetota bacterium]